MIFHWPPSQLDAMTVDELVGWRNKAVALHNQIHAPDTE